MDIKALRYFVEVVKQQNFTRASEKLFVTQPTISKMLKSLEEELGGELLHREGRKLILTDTGKVVFERAKIILAEFRLLETELDDLRNLNKGQLRLGIPPGCGMLIARCICSYRRKYPGVDMTIIESGGLAVQQSVINSELDVALTVLPMDDKCELMSIPLLSYPLCVLVPASDEWSGRTYVTPEDLVNHSLLIYREDFAIYPRLLKLFNQHGIQPDMVVRSGQWDFLAEMVRSGAGVAILPEPVCRNLNREQLYSLPFKSELCLQLGMIWRNDRYLSRSARAWLNCCQDILNQGNAFC